MRIPITKYGLPQVALLPLIILALIAIVLAAKNVLPLWLLWAVEAILVILFVFVLSFFRDPYRLVPPDKNLLLSPADGKIADIETVDENSFIGGKAIRIGIFLSVFNVHINRSPCDAKVEKIIYKKGGFKDARHPQAGTFNESNDLYLIRKGKASEKMIVRQISGAIARRIVCQAKTGEELAGGQQFGMIKFGSRTELYVPADAGHKMLVKIGDNVKAGISILMQD